MSEVAFSDLPPSARVWIYGAEATLTAEQARDLEEHMNSFVAEWRSHGREVTPSWRLEHDRFVVIGADETAFRMSGCSIDSMGRAVEAFSRASSVDLSNSGGNVFYRDAAGAIRRVDRPAFAELARRGVVDASTIVFDNTVATVEDFRAGRWEVPMRESWHMEVFG